MSSNLELLRKSIAPKPILAAAEGVAIAVALTEDELATGKAGPFRRGTVERFPLRALTGVRAIPNPHATLLEIEFGKPRERSVTVLYEADQRAEFERIEAFLRDRLQEPPGEHPAGETPAQVSDRPQPASDAIEEESGTRRARIIVALMLAPLIVIYFAEIFLR